MRHLQVGAPEGIRTPDPLVRSQYPGSDLSRWAARAIEAAARCKSHPDYAPRGPILQRFRGRFATGGTP